ncbi:MAG: hypothetical protein WAU01_17045 [Saprospiraceae bacterium]
MEKLVKHIIILLILLSGVLANSFANNLVHKSIYTQSQDVQKLSNGISAAPVIGTPLDIGNAIFYGYQGEWYEAGFCIVGIIPFGEVVKYGDEIYMIARISNNGIKSPTGIIKAGQILYKMVENGKTVARVFDANKVFKKLRQINPQWTDAEFLVLANKLAADLNQDIRLLDAIGRNHDLVRAWEALAKSNLDDAFRRNVDYLDNISKHSTSTGKSADEIVAIAKNNENGAEQFLDELENTPASGHWDLDPFQRGRNIEDDLGQNLPETFKTIDKFDFTTGDAVSIKSLDLDAKTYQNASKLKSRLNKYAKDLDEFTEYTISGVTVGDPLNPINLKTLEVALPRAASGSQLSAINEVIQTWSSKLTIKIIIVP